MAHRKQFRNYIDLFRSVFFARIGSVLLINVVLIGLATQYPKEAMVLYLLLPIISFFFPQFRLKRSVRKHITKKADDDASAIGWPRSRKNMMRDLFSISWAISIYLSNIVNKNILSALFV